MSDLVERVAKAMHPIAFQDHRIPEDQAEAYKGDARRRARAAIAEVLDEVERHLSAVQYDPAPYTALKHRLAQFKAENVKTDQGWTGEGSSLPPLGLIGPK